MVENSPLDVSTWIRRLGPDFKDSIAPYGLSCVFTCHQIRVDEPLLLLLILPHLSYLNAIWRVSGAPSGEGAFHTEVFANRILGRLYEAWPRRRVTRGIAPPQYIYPIMRYKQWWEDDMKWILRDEKAYMKTSTKARRAE